MAPLAARIEASLRETPRPVYVAYVHPRLRRFFDGMAALELLAEGEGYAVWRAGEEQVLLTLSLSPTPEGEAKRSEAMTSQGSDSQ
jgi:hypothetical protein